MVSMRRSRLGVESPPYARLCVRAGFAEQWRERRGEGMSGLAGQGGAWRAVLCFLPVAVLWPGQRGHWVSAVSRWVEDPRVGPS